MSKYVSCLVGCIAALIVIGGAGAHAKGLQVLDDVETMRRMYFAWCTGRAMPPPSTNLAERDPRCAQAAESHARVHARAIELSAEARKQPRVSAAERERAEWAYGFLSLVGPGLVCRAMNDLRAGVRTERGECTGYDERMEGSALDLVALGRALDRQPHEKNVALYNAQTLTVQNRVLERHPAGSPVALLVAWLSGLGCECKEARCTFDDAKHAYSGGDYLGWGWRHYEWTIAITADSANNIASVIVEVGSLQPAF